MAFAAPPHFAALNRCHSTTARRRLLLCARHGETKEENEAIETPSRGLPPPASPSILLEGPQAVAGIALAGSALLVDLVARVARTLTSQSMTVVQEEPSLASIAKASAARLAALHARDMAMEGVTESKRRLNEIELELESLVPDIEERERRIELVRQGEMNERVNVDVLLDEIRASVDGMIAQSDVAKTQSEEAQKQLKRKQNSVRKLRRSTNGKDANSSIISLQNAKDQLRDVELVLMEVRKRNTTVANELKEARREEDKIRAQIAALDVEMPKATVMADRVIEMETRRGDIASRLALDQLVDELEMATKEKAAILRLAEAQSSSSIPRQLDAAQDAFAARLRRAEGVLQQIERDRAKREKAVENVLDQVE